MREYEGLATGPATISLAGLLQKGCAMVPCGFWSPAALFFLAGAALQYVVCIGSVSARVPGAVLCALESCWQQNWPLFCD